MPFTSPGITHITSTNSVSAVLAHLLSMLEARAITVFAVVDHSGEAKRIDIEMHDTKLVIFGSPQAGSPVMIAAPDSALDLPLKILIAETPEGSTRISYNSTAYLQARYGLEAELVKKLAVVEQIAAIIAA